MLREPLMGIFNALHLLLNLIQAQIVLIKIDENYSFISYI